MKRKITRVFTNNIGLKMLSLLIAFVIWLIVSNIDNPVKSVLFRNVPIDVINEDSVTDIDKVFDIVSEEKVIIKVTEKKSVINSVSKDGSDFYVVADMENLTEMGTVPLVVTCANPSITMDEMEIVPSSMKVKLEQKKQLEFVVNVSIVGQLRGYEVGKTEILQGKTIQIAGPESMVDKIGQVVASCNISQLQSNHRIQSSLTIYDKNGDLFTENQMSRLQIKDAAGVPLSENTVTVEVEMWKLENSVPLEIGTTGTPAEGYELGDITVLPAEINLVGEQSALNKLNGKLAISDLIDISGAKESFTTEVDLEDTLASIDDIRIASDSESVISVSVNIEKNGDQTVSVPLSALDIQNKPKKMTLTYSPADVVIITVHSDSLKELAVDDMKAAIDLTECTEPGIYEIPVQIELPKEYTLLKPVSLIVTADKEDAKKKETTDSEEEE